MIEVDKVYSDNPFVDEMIYYCKIIALNSVVKDEEEALKSETPTSLHNGDTYIACVEKRANYEMFSSFPQEILEKYIKTKSNLDIMVENYGNLIAHLDSMGVYQRTNVLNNLSKLAQTIYIDHYDIMMNYLKDLSPTWLDDNKDLYDICRDNTATYKDLFSIIPNVTVKRIVKQYIDNYDNSNIDDICKDIESFQGYIDSRTDGMYEEIAKINKAMCGCFESHYDTIINRKYLVEDSKNNWYDYIQFTDIYDKCIEGKATYVDIYPLMPTDDVNEVLLTIIDAETITRFNLDTSLSNLIEYFKNYSTKSKEEISIITKAMIKKYVANYNVYLNFDIYNKSKDNLLSYYEMTKYMPKETLKIILNTEIEEVTNIEVYSESKKTLNSYFNTIDPSKARSIKDSLALDMQPYYISNYTELNNYYRIVMGLPPIKDNKVYRDTLTETYDAKSDSYISFGRKFIDMIPEGIYPEIHWTKSQIYEFDAYDIGILTEYGILDEYIAECGGSSNDRYKYLKYLGDSALDIYTCRNALNFQLISTPSVSNTSIKNKFIDKYAINRDYIIKTIYSDAYKFQSDYYNKFIIIFILVNTILDVLSDIPSLIINREIFDSRSIKYLFESSGIPYYSEIPVKYQQAMLKNLNILIKYKSSTKNMIDICSLFGFDDIRVFGYYMLKEKNTDINTGEYLFDENNSITYDLEKLYVRDPSNGTHLDVSGVKYSKLLEYREYDPNRYTHTISIKGEDSMLTQRTIINNDVDCYIKDPNNDVYISLKDTEYFTKVKKDKETENVKFIKVPINKSLTDYKNDSDYVISYDEIVDGDETWDGGLQKSYVKNKILDYEFNSVLTKYISVETITEMTDLAFQVSYFYNMLFDNLYSEEALTVEIPYIKPNHKFKFVDVLCYLFSMMYLYNGLEDNIMYSPTQILYVKGYNFNESLNDVLKDDKAFTQTSNPMKQENIFDVNERIAEDKYDYKDAFRDYKIRAFNLQVDMDEIDEWLSQYQLSLDDFIVDDTLTTFDRVITLRQFYSLNNSYYQKNLFKNALLPTPYNQDIKYAFDSKLYKKEYIKNIDGIPLEYIKEEVMNGNKLLDSYYELLINDTDDSVYIMDNYKYITRNKESHCLFRKFNKNGINYTLDSVDYYTMNSDKKYQLLLNGNIFIKNENGNYVLSADAFYEKDKDGAYIEITRDNVFLTDSNNKKILNLGNYFILENGKYVLAPDNCYVVVKKDKETQYILLRDAGDYEHVEVDASKCFIKHSDGHFIPLLDTDYYTKNEDGSYTYNKEIAYIVSEAKTEYFDPDKPDIFYQKLTDYYNNNDYTILKDQYYVKDPDGNFIKEQDLVSPGNCYIQDTESKQYWLAVNQYVEFNIYTDSLDRRYVMILQDSNEYNKYQLVENTYSYVEIAYMKYIKDCQKDYVLALLMDAKYDITKEMIVVLNKDVSGSQDVNTSNIYDPENDNTWDENDWFYKDKSFDDDSIIGMNGENKWYYKKPGSSDTDTGGVINPVETVASGFYLSSDKYLGSTKLENGQKYYMSMDIETNFDNTIQIACEADRELDKSTSRNYTTINGEVQHISQVFTANEIESPRLIFYIYNYNERPIKNGSYIIVKNIRFVKAYSDGYISQDIPSYDKLQELYKTNEAIYKYLLSKMEDCSELKQYNIYKKLYDSLMISKYNKDAFKLPDDTYAKTYTDFLQTRDSVLYERLTYFRSLDTQTMQKEIADNIIEVTYAIDDCVDTYSYGYLYSYFPAVSATYIQQYISKIINFFKSWKVHLIGINTIYRFNDKYDNMIKILEDQEYKIKIDNQISHVVINDSVKINPMDDINPAGRKYSDLYQDLISYDHNSEAFTNEYSYDVTVKDSIKVVVKTDNAIEYYDDNIRISLSNEEAKANLDENGNLIVSDNSGLSVEIPNNLLLDTNEDEEQWFASQKISEINKDTTNI